jgi:hypothetical protein
MEREDLVGLIRKRPGMYIGDPDPHRLLWELVANCVDVELTGRPLNIDVELHADGSASVQVLVERSVPGVLAGKLWGATTSRHASCERKATSS